MDECVFCRIAAEQGGEIAVFPSIEPRTPFHMLVIPSKHVEDLKDLDKKILIQIFEKMEEIVEENGLAKMGYRIVTNGGTAKAISHLHFHLLGKIDPKREV